MSKVTQEIAQYPGGARTGSISRAPRNRARLAQHTPARSEHRDMQLWKLPSARYSRLPGRRGPRSLDGEERLDALNAALINGTSSHVFDFDDTILSCAFHPTGPIAAARWHCSDIGPRPAANSSLLSCSALTLQRV